MISMLLFLQKFNSDKVVHTVEARHIYYESNEACFQGLGRGPSNFVSVIYKKYI